VYGEAENNQLPQREIAIISSVTSHREKETTALKTNSLLTISLQPAEGKCV
jgi:hypothetical protein